MSVLAKIKLLVKWSPERRLLRSPTEPANAFMRLSLSAYAGNVTPIAAAQVPRT